MRLVIAFVLSSFAFVSTGYAEEPIADLQGLLTERQCYHGPVDGDWGPGTDRAVAAFSIVSGITLSRPLDQPGLDLAKAALGTCHEPTLIERFIPPDIISGIAQIPQNERENLCRATPSSIEQLSSLSPSARIEGLNSIMDNVAEVPGYRDMTVLTDAFSEAATDAYVTNNAELKRFLLTTLGEWASTGAYLETKDCSNGDCKASYQDKFGQDPAPDQDSSNTLNAVMATAFAYYTLLQDFEPVELASTHAVIASWLEAWSERLYNRQSRQAKSYFGFGLGWNWWNLLADMRDGRDGDVDRRLKLVAASIEELLHEDGSLDERTTRGDRAFWYHYSALDELIFTLEILKANGMDLYPKYRDRLDKAVAIFLDTGEDPSTILPWAKEGWHNGQDGTHQDFSMNEFLGKSLGSSWVYIYLNRFPDSELSTRLRAVIADASPLHKRDGTIGMNVGCLYRILDPSLRAVEASGESALLASIAKETVQFDSVSVRYQSQEGDFEDYKVTVSGVQIGDQAPRTMQFGILADYANDDRDTKGVNLLRLYFETRQLSDVISKEADFAECGDMVWGEEWKNVKLHYGQESSMNSCVFKKLGSQDLSIWFSIFNNLGRMLGTDIAGDAGKKLKELYSVKGVQ